MQGDIKYDFCQEMFHKSALFRDLDASFLRAVAAKVQVVITNPEMLLFAQGVYICSVIRNSLHRKQGHITKYL